MAIRKCVICGTEFNTHSVTVTCSEKCSEKKKELDKIARFHYNKEYYLKNWLKWREYRKDAKRKVVGTTDLGEKMHRDDDGEIDFKGEKKLIKKEMVRLGLRYEK